MIAVPTVQYATPEESINYIEKVSPYFQEFSIDIQDGRYVSTKTMSLQELLDYVKKTEVSYRDKSFTFDLMTMSPEKDIEVIDKLISFFPTTGIFVHDSTIDDYNILHAKYSYLPIGFSLNPEESVESLSKKYDLVNIPILQIMTIHPGPQGQAFMPECLKKIEQLRKLNYRHKIYLDGGINQTTLPLITQLVEKPDAVCMGSYFSQAHDVQSALHNVPID